MGFEQMERGNTFTRYWLLGGLATVAFAGCSCEEPGSLTQRRPQIHTFDPRTPEADREPELAELDFGAVPMGARVELALAVKNEGDDVLRICVTPPEGGSLDCKEPTRLQPDVSPFGFTFDNLEVETGTWGVEKGDTREVLISFTPQVEGGATASLILIHNAGQGSSSIVLKGNGVAPRVDFSTTALDFGDVTVNQRRELDLVLTNGTQFNQPVSIAPIAQDAVIFGVRDPDGIDVPFDQPFTGSIPRMGSLTIKVFFQPPEEREFMNVMDVQFCPTCTQTISLRGRGVKPLFELDPALLDFGTTDEGVPVTRSFRIRNIGNVPLTVFSVGLSPMTTMEFTPTAQVPLPSVLQPTETLEVAVTYVGTTPGADMGQVEVVTDAWDNPETPQSETTGYVSLTATSQGPDINAFPPVVNFGTVAIMGRSTRTLSIQNTGNAPLEVANIQLNSTTPEITLMGAPGGATTVQPGNSIDMTVLYNPQDAGPDTADIVVTSNDRDEGTLVVPVNGVGGVPTTCSIFVAPSQLTFGLVERGRVATLPVEIRNAGAQPCSITNMRLNGGVEFMLTNAQPSVTVPPGSSQRVSISYAPTAYGTLQTVLEFTSDDPAQMNVQVPITGASQPSQVLVIPSQLEFNVVPVTCRSPVRVITIYNTGASAVQVTQVYLDPTTTPEFELTPFNVPTNIPAGGQAIIQMRYHPVDIGTDTGVLFIVHSAAMFPVAVPLSGEGQISPTVTDTFQQVPTPQADVLFVIDNSGSMSEEQSSLGNNLASFLQFAQQQNIDFHIGVTTTDVDSSGARGRFVSGPNNQVNGMPRVLDPQTPNLITVFRSFVNQGTNGSGSERGLEAAYLALSDPLINTHNAGFLRTDAALAVIVVSDEEDYSNRQVTFYDNFFRNIKGFGNSSMFSFSAVVGIQPGGCNGSGGSADYGARYVQTANTTGGVVESICAANWGQTLANIGLNSFGLRRQFTLSSQPVPVTIAVTVNGQPVPSTGAGGQVNWTYDQSTNSINFTASAVPQPGATITVTYTVACLP